MHPQGIWMLLVHFGFTLSRPTSRVTAGSTRELVRTGSRMPRRHAALPVYLTGASRPCLVTSLL